MRILHISDIQSGKSGIESNLQAKYKEQWLEYYKGYINELGDQFKALHLKSPFDLIVISGDLSTTGDEQEFEFLSNYFMKMMDDVFIKSTNPVPKEKWIIIPGNHDIKWETNNKRFINFIKFCQKNSFIINYIEDSPFSIYRSLIYKEDNITFEIYGLNSCIEIKNKETNNNITLPIAYLKNIFSNSNNSRIIITHHRLHEISKNLEDPLPFLLSQRVSLSLTGDVHVSKEYVDSINGIPCISAGSLMTSISERSTGPDVILRQFNVYNINLNKAIISINIYKRNGDQWDSSIPFEIPIKCQKQNRFLEVKALDWSLRHSNVDKDTELFPIPFELDIIKNNWKIVKNDLLKIPIREYKWNTLRKFQIPKKDVGFRWGCQLDPLDSFFFDAIIRTIGINIENKRIPEENKIVFSYRFTLLNGVHFYTPDFNWMYFWKSSLKCAKDSNWVLSFDILDFYNSVPHYFIREQLKKCLVMDDYIDGLMNLLEKFAPQLIGIPVGPHGSHLLAEMCLIPVDNFLIKDGMKFCRYNDDYHVFCQEENDRDIVIQKIEGCLNNINLHINPAKISWTGKYDFIQKCNLHLNLNEEDIIESKIFKFLDDQGRSIYPLENYIDNELLKEFEKNFNEEQIELILKKYTDKPNEDSLRAFLQCLAVTGISFGVSYLIANIEAFYSVLKEIGVFLNRIIQNKDQRLWKRLGNELFKLINNKVILFNQFLLMSILHLFSNAENLDHFDEIVKLYNIIPTNCKRDIILIAIQQKQIPWINSIKDSFHKENDPWLNRAILYSNAIFSIQNVQDWKIYYDFELSYLERLILEYIKSLNY